MPATHGFLLTASTGRSSTFIRGARWQLTDIGTYDGTQRKLLHNLLSTLSKTCGTTRYSLK